MAHTDGGAEVVVEIPFEVAEDDEDRRELFGTALDALFQESVGEMNPFVVAAMTHDFGESQKCALAQQFSDRLGGDGEDDRDGDENGDEKWDVTD